jgi:hypothetical protein
MQLRHEQTFPGSRAPRHWQSPTFRPRHGILVDEVTVVCQGKFTHQITGLTKNASNSFDQERLDRTVSSSYPAIVPPLSPCHPGPSVPKDGHFEDSLAVTQAGKESTKWGQCTYIFCTIVCDSVPTDEWCDVAGVTVDMLPDVALLRIFDFYVDKAPIEAWRTLVHVCQTWRNVVFGSPRRLNLRLDCRASSPVREMLDIWPPLPIRMVIIGLETRGLDNIIATLEHNDRIRDLAISGIPSMNRETIWAALQQPFPELADLQLAFLDETPFPVVPASFLGGSAPALRLIRLDSVPYPGVPNLLLSATHLVDLYLQRIPDSGYFSPEAMVTALFVLIRLEILEIWFESDRSRPDLKTRYSPPRTRTLLPALTMLIFRGVAEYLEDLVAPIDAPLVDTLGIFFFKFHQLIFETPQLNRLINRTPKFKAHGDARVELADWEVTVVLPQTFDGEIELGLTCWPQSDWGLSSVVQLCESSLPPAFIPAVEHLYIIQNKYSKWFSSWQENSHWLELFRPFTAVKNLYIASEFTSRIALALQELIGERVTEVLPALQTLFLEEPLQSGPLQEAIEQFAAARQLSSHPVAVSRWEREK